MKRKQQELTYIFHNPNDITTFTNALIVLAAEAAVAKVEDLILHLPDEDTNKKQDKLNKEN